MTASFATIAVQPAPPTSPGGTAGSLRTALLVFGSLTLLLTLFLVVIAVLMLERRRRGRRSGSSGAGHASGVDPWSEAGRRAGSSGGDIDDD